MFFFGPHVIFTTRIRSLREGYAFMSVCLSFHTALTTAIVPLPLPHGQLPTAWGLSYHMDLFNLVHMEPALLQSLHPLASGWLASTERFSS